MWSEIYRFIYMHHKEGIEKKYNMREHIFIKITIYFKNGVTTNMVLYFPPYKTSQYLGHFN